MGLLPLDEGSVTIDGGSSEAARRRDLVGYVPQDDAIDRDFPITVREVVMTGRYGRMGVLRRPSPADREIIRDVKA